MRQRDEMKSKQAEIKLQTLNYAPEPFYHDVHPGTHSTVMPVTFASQAKGSEWTTAFLVLNKVSDKGTHETYHPCPQG